MCRNSTQTRSTQREMRKNTCKHKAEHIPPLRNQQNPTWQAASDDRHTLSRHQATAPIIVLILLALQLPSRLLFTVGFYSPQLREVLAVTQLDLQSWMKSSSGGAAKRKKKKKRSMLETDYLCHIIAIKNTQMWVVWTARESTGVSIVMVNTQRGGGGCATQQGSCAQWTGCSVKWDIKKSGNLLAIWAAFCRAESLHAARPPAAR